MRQSRSPSSSPACLRPTLATETAATRRGWVQPIFPRSANPSSAKYCVICVVFPDPVSPTTIKIWFYTPHSIERQPIRMKRGKMSDRTYISDGLHQLFPQLVDRQTLPLILDTQTGDLSVRHRLVRRLPSRLLERLCTHQVAPQV